VAGPVRLRVLHVGADLVADARAEVLAVLAR
jgi:hypothetical protein